MATETLLRLRDRNQLTIPAEVVQQLGMTVGDGLVLSLAPGGVLLRPVRIPLAASARAEASFERSLAERIQGDYRVMDPKQDPIEQIEGLVGKEFSPTTELVEIEVLLERAMGLVKGLPVGRPTRSEDHLEVAPSAAPVSHLERAPFKIR